MDEQKMRGILNELTNNSAGGYPAVFLLAMRKLHPTLQQIFTGLCMKWINEHARTCTDPRNQASGEACQNVLICYKQATGEEKLPDKFPFI